MKKKISLASIVAKCEGKKHQASISDIREILKVLAALEAAQPGLVSIQLLTRAMKLRKKIK